MKSNNVTPEQLIERLAGLNNIFSLEKNVNLRKHSLRRIFVGNNNKDNINNTLNIYMNEKYTEINKVPNGSN